MSFSEEAFEFGRRHGVMHEMSARAYIMTLVFLIVSGLAGATVIGSVTYSMEPNILWFLGYFVLAIPGIFMSAKSDNWLVSLVGYAMVVVPTGAILGPYVALYTLNSVVPVVFITMGATAALGVAGAIYPKSVEHWGGFLLMALLALIFGDLARIGMVAFGLAPVTLKVLDYVAVLLFSGFIFYDMNRAMRMSYTLDNAVDCAVALYLDILNLFVRLLAIMGKKK